MENPLKTKLLAEEDVEKRALYVNKIKAAEKGSEFADLMLLEFEELEKSITASLKSAAVTCENLPLLVGRLQGIEIARATLFSDWPVEKHEE